MTGFFQELAKKLAERWVALLVLPGILFVVGAVVGLHLRHAHALDPATAAAFVTARTTAITKWPGGAQAALVVGLLIAASTTGLLVQGTAGATRRLFLGRWPARLLTRRRADRWTALLARRRELVAAHPAETRKPEQQREIDAVAAKMNAIALAAPGRPTWMGDRTHAVESVAQHRYGLDLTFAWPRLWLVLPDTARTEITAAHASFAAAVAVASWAWPLLVLGFWWWPATVIGLVVGATGRARARDAIGDLTSLTESALDLHGRALAEALGAADDGVSGPLTREEGLKITSLVRKGR